MAWAARTAWTATGLSTTLCCHARFAPPPGSDLSLSRVLLKIFAVWYSYGHRSSCRQQQLLLVWLIIVVAVVLVVVVVSSTVAAVAVQG